MPEDGSRAGYRNIVFQCFFYLLHSGQSTKEEDFNLFLQFMKFHVVSLGEWLPFDGARRLHIQGSNCLLTE